MRNKEFKRHIAYEVLTILGTLALLLFVCRLWPILLLVILGIFIAAMRLLFLSARKVENIPPLLPAARPEPTDQDIRDMAFGSMQRRITELVTADFPNARWVWKTPNAMRNIATGNEVRILLNHAGGYREAIVVIRGLQVCSLTYPHAEEVKMPETENDETGTEETEDDTPQKVDPPENYAAAKYFMPDVEFIIDIGGQDIKCFKIHNGAIDNIFLNEACSSGRSA